MKLLALVLGLFLERVATELLHLRELRWFDAYFDFGLALAKRTQGNGLVYSLVVLLLLIPAVPVLLLSLWLLHTGVRWDLPYLIFAVFVVFLCLGPRDLGNEVHEYCSALDSGDTETANRVLIELAEAQEPDAQVEVVEDAIFVQAANRIFGVVFWFIVLGPVGAWLFRVTDLLRRRAAFESLREPDLGARVVPAIETTYGFLKWLPVRLAVLGYALTGSFDDASNAWRNFSLAEGVPFHSGNDRLSAAVGKAAMVGSADQPSNSSAAARNAMRLVSRTLFIWMTLIAVMTIFGWAV